MPLDVSIGLKDAAETTLLNCSAEEERRVIETMLAHNTQLNPCRGCD
jgi:hypothetical protein